MDTSISPELRDTTVADLLGSEFCEERALGELAQRIVRELLAKLKPILKYVTVPTELSNTYVGECGEIYHCRAAKLISFRENRNAILLTGEASFLLVRDCDCGRRVGAWSPHRVWYASSGRGELTWENFPLGRILDSLENLLKQAEKTKEEHLRGIVQRRVILEKMLELLKK